MTNCARLERLPRHPGLCFVRVDLADQARVAEMFARQKFQRVVHLGAQVGVRHSLQDRTAASAVTWSVHSIFWKAAAITVLSNLVYTSTSSVYGVSTRMPFSVHEPASHPLSL